MNDAVTEHDAVGSHHFRDRQRRGDLHGRNAGLF
jgi:hypothetical protein